MLLFIYSINNYLIILFLIYVCFITPFILLRFGDIRLRGQDDCRIQTHCSALAFLSAQCSAGRRTGSVTVACFGRDKRFITDVVKSWLIVNKENRWASVLFSYWFLALCRWCFSYFLHRDCPLRWNIFNHYLFKCTLTFIMLCSWNSVGYM